MSGGSINYGDIPSRLGVCGGPYCPNREALRVRQLMLKYDPNNDGKLTKTEVSRYYPCVNWNILLNSYRQFYNAWFLRRFGPECWNENNTWARTRRLLGISFRCVKKPIKKISAPIKKRRPSIRKRKKKIGPPKPNEFALLEKKRGDIRNKYVPKAVEKSGAGHGSIKGKKDGCDCNNGWLAAVIAGVVILLGIRWLLGKRKKDDDGGDKNGRPIDWNALATKTTEPEQEFDWNAMVKPVPTHVAPAAPKTVEITASFEFLPRDRGFGLRDQAQSIAVYFERDLEIGDILICNGLNDPLDGIRIPYYWLQERMKAQINNPEELSRMFNDLASAYGGVKYSDESLGYHRSEMDLDNLINRVKHQLEEGHPLFNVEANMAHLTAYLSGHQRLAKSFHDATLGGALKALAEGDSHEVFRWLGMCASEDIDKNVFSLEADTVMSILNMTAAEYYYRMVCVDSDSYILNRAQSMAAKAAFVTRYAEKLYKTISEPHNRIGIDLPGYGPVTASLEQRGPNVFRIMPLTSAGINMK